MNWFFPYFASVKCSLNQLAKGKKGSLLYISDPQLELKLLEYGFREGVELEVIELAPLGDPMMIENGSTKLVLRKSETSKIWVQPH